MGQFIQGGVGCLRLNGVDAHFRTCMKDKHFVCHMARLNSIGIVGAPPYCSTFTSERIGNSHQSYQFGTFTLPHFTSLHKLWYKQVDGKNIQVLPDNVAYLLTPIAIGYWLASDGSYSQRDAVVTIYTDSFSPDEVVYPEGFCLSGMASFLHDTRMVTLRSSS